MRCPVHLKDYIVPIGDFATVLPGPLSDLFVGYKVVCTCGNPKFYVVKNARPLVIARCQQCKTEIILYDTKQYPSACSYSNEGELVDVSSGEGCALFDVCVAFEYPEPDDDEEYSDNDISWCYIFGCPNGDVQKAFTIINDETM